MHRFVGTAMFTRRDCGYLLMSALSLQTFRRTVLSLPTFVYLVNVLSGADHETLLHWDGFDFLHNLKSLNRKRTAHSYMYHLVLSTKLARVPLIFLPNTDHIHSLHLRNTKLPYTQTSTAHKSHTATRQSERPASTSPT